MARVTVEDCVQKVPNRFELVMLAAQRARDISAGAPLAVERDRDKNPVVALREIAEDHVPTTALREAIIQGMQRHAEIDEPEEELAAEAAALSEAVGEPTPEEEVREDALTVIDENASAEATDEGETA